MKFKKTLPLNLTLLNLILTLAVLLNTTTAQDSSVQINHQLCNEGCLKCSPQGNCEFCDVQRNYFLNNDTCIKITIQNCVVYTFKGNCKSCDTNFFLIDSKCKEIEENNRVKNCFIHKSPGICMECKDNHIVVKGSCDSINLDIESCRRFNSSGTLCTNCEDYVLAENFDKCDKGFPSLSNCKQ